MIMRNAIITAALLIIPAVATAELLPGGSCELSEGVRLKKTPGGKRGVLVRKGTAVEIRGRDGDWYEVIAGDEAGFAKAAWLEKICAPTTPTPDEPSPPPEPDPAVAAPEEPSAPEPPPEPAVAVPAEPSSPAREVAVAPTGPTSPEPSPPESAVEPAEPTSDAAPAGTTNDGFGETYKIKVAVMDLQVAGNLDEALVISLTKAVPETIDRLGPFKAISAPDGVQMLSYDATRQALGCDDPSCMSDLGDALGADFMITGNLTLTGETVTIQLQLLNTANGKVENRVSRQHVGTGETIFSAMAGASKILMRPILGQHSGSLLVHTIEEGATITIGGNIVGVTPMDTPMTLSGGTHTLGIEKSGFIQYRQDVSISEDRKTDVEVNLVPSQEFIRAYRSEAGLRRILSYVSLGVGAVGFGTGIALIVVGQEQQRALADDIAAYNETDARSTAEYDALNSRASELGGNELGTFIAFGIGAAAATTGVLLWVLGDDPDRYDAHQRTEVGATVGVTLAPGWLGVAGEF